MEGGQVDWNWEQLLQHTIAADQELESLGYNPAEAFRRYRRGNDTEAMYRYIVGFYAYPFSPNHKDRSTKPPFSLSPETPGPTTASAAAASEEKVGLRSEKIAVNRLSRTETPLPALNQIKNSIKEMRDGIIGWVEQLEQV